jgi:Ca-activated chloride channel family protein
MTRFATLAVAASLGAISVTAQQLPRFRAGVNLVEVDVVVVDDDGKMVSGLTQDDFELREDGRRLPLATFVQAADAGSTQQESRFLVLLLDNLVAEPMMTTNIKSIARRFANRMGARDEMAVVLLDGGRGTSSTNRGQALAAIERFRPLGGTIRTHLYEETLSTIAGLTGQLAPVKHRRKTLVFIGSPQVFKPTETYGRQGDSTYSSEWFDAVRAAARANVSVYVIDPEGLTGGRPDDARTFAEETGGEAFVNSNLFDRAADQIWAEAGHYYLLGYEPPPSNAKSHAIEVRVNRPGMHVRARRTRG